MIKQLSITSLALIMTAQLALAQKGKTKTDKPLNLKQPKSVAAVNASDKLTTPSGLRYKILESKGNAKGRLGDNVFVHFVYRNHKDSVVNSSYAMGKDPMSFKITPPPVPGGAEEIFTMIGTGDSAMVWLAVDSLFKGADPSQVPPFLKLGTDVTMSVRIFKIATDAELKQQQSIDLDKFAQDNKLNAQKTQSNLRVAITKPGEGANPQRGDKVKVHYTGKLLNGKEFDSSIPRGQPFEFTLGQGQVIRGWDEGIAMLNKGSKAFLLIPSDLGYGEQGSPPAIPANSPLVFEVELIDFYSEDRAAPAAPIAEPIKEAEKPASNPDKGKKKKK